MNEKKLSQGFMFDTNIFNSILDGEIEIELFNRFKLYVTHIQSDELTATRDVQRREKLTEIFKKIPQEKMLTESGVWDISSWDDFKWSDPNDHLLEEILAEKLRSLLTRTEPRDLYDVHYLLTNQLVDIERVVFGAKPKFDAKGLIISDLRTILIRRQRTFSQLWLPRLQGQMPDIPPLDRVIRETNRILQRYF